MRAFFDFPRDARPNLTGWLDQPRLILTTSHIDKVTQLLAEAEKHARNGAWVIGFVSYEAAPAFDASFKTHAPLNDLPLAAFMVFNKPITRPDNLHSSFSCSVWKNDTGSEKYKQTIENIRANIESGQYYQTNYTTRLMAAFDGNALALFKSLCEAQPDSYAAFLDFKDFQITSVSPELFFDWNPTTRQLTTKPMKGTSSLLNSDEDLQKSDKDRAENLMIVDLLRNDIARVADKVEVPKLFHVQTLSTIRQMTSTITGVTKKQAGLADIFKALFPCGSITGAPKIAAMQAITQYENSPRGAYCGAIGIIRPGGEALFSVGIRTVTVTKNKAICGIGSGITWDSNPADEYAENQIKQRFLWRASASFDLLETMRLEDGKIWLSERHLQRLRKSADYFGFVYDETKIRHALENCATQNPNDVIRIRLLADRKANVKIETSPLASFRRKSESSGTINNNDTGHFLQRVSMDSDFHRNDAEYIKIADSPVDSTDEFLRHKTTHRTVYEAHAPKDPAVFDTLLFNEPGEITEFTRGNVAVELDGKLYTPPKSCGLLPGTLREEMLAKGEMTERILSLNDLSRSTSLWFLNGLRGLIPVKLQ